MNLPTFAMIYIAIPGSRAHVGTNSVYIRFPYGAKARTGTPDYRCFDDLSKSSHDVSLIAMDPFAAHGA